ncbi:hypothetical protein SAMN05443633_12058 [Chryseobacterium arachidis]|uniref:Uncharacterized protein n=1 Tax=Chryseobacterium arachidis TaxID=1416778 RepID=A0A1M5LXP6_9FLAO|nr:hypothetical protein SAMN05443633_12058 [Chryseobacterium arachidis]
MKKAKPHFITFKRKVYKDILDYCIKERGMILYSY